MSLSNLKLTITTDRKLVQVECDDFRVKLNGNTNDSYKKLLKEFGIELVYQAEPDKPELLKMGGIAINTITGETHLIQG